MERTLIPGSKPSHGVSSNIMTLPWPQVERWQLQTPKVYIHPWDQQNQDAVLSLEAKFHQLDDHSPEQAEKLLDQLKWMRVVEERIMTMEGLNYTANSSFQGTCIDMCPPLERIQRYAAKKVEPWELDHTTGVVGRYAAVKIVPVVADSVPLPLDVRPPWVLKLTVDYLVNCVATFLPRSYRYLWNAFGLVMQDFAWQRVYSPDTVYCCERVLRFHLWLMHHMLPVTPAATRHRQFGMFRRRLRLLSRVYWHMADADGNAAISPEFYGYYLLTNFDLEVDDEVMLTPLAIQNHDYVQLALELRWFVALHDVEPTTDIGITLDTYQWFFETVYGPRVPVLAACLLEGYFDIIRYHGLRAIASLASYKRVRLSCIARTLGFADTADARMYIENYGIAIDDNNTRFPEVVFDRDQMTKLQPRHWRRPAAKIRAKFDGMLPSQAMRPPAVIAASASEDTDTDLYRRWLREWCRPDPAARDVVDPTVRPKSDLVG